MNYDDDTVHRGQPGVVFPKGLRATIAGHLGMSGVISRRGVSVNIWIFGTLPDGIGYKYTTRISVLYFSGIGSVLSRTVSGYFRRIADPSI
jgi:hypothetical protein